MSTGRTGLCVFLCLFGACSKDDESGDTDTETTPIDDTGTYYFGDACEPPGTSRCDNKASLVRGWVSLDPKLESSQTSGDLLVILTHYHLGDSGSAATTSTTRVWRTWTSRRGPCTSKWTCAMGTRCGQRITAHTTYCLSWTATAMRLPKLISPRRASRRQRTGVYISCHADSLCLDVKLDCDRGSACFRYDAQLAAVRFVARRAAVGDQQLAEHVRRAAEPMIE